MWLIVLSQPSFFVSTSNGEWIKKAYHFLIFIKISIETFCQLIWILPNTTISLLATFISSKVQWWEFLLMGYLPSRLNKTSSYSWTSFKMRQKRVHQTQLFLLMVYIRWEKFFIGLSNLYPLINEIDARLIVIRACKVETKCIKRNLHKINMSKVSKYCHDLLNKTPDIMANAKTDFNEMTCDCCDCCWICSKLSCFCVVFCRNCLKRRFILDHGANTFLAELHLLI